MYKLYFTSLSFIICFQFAISKDVNLNVSYLGFLDNREYFNDYTEHQSFFGNNIDISGSTSINNHSFEAGFINMYEFGNIIDRYKHHFIANYKYTDNKLDFYFGTFKRDGLNSYPLSLLTDSLKYYRPLLEGCLLRFKHHRGHQQVWIDWTSRQTDTIRETFLAGVSGKEVFNQFFIENYILMYHHAKPAINSSGLSIRDNGGAALFAGYNLKSGGLLDSLTFKIGEAFAYDRDRSQYDVVNTYFSTILSVRAQVRKWMVDASFYIGDGMEVMYGDHIYRAPNYGRFELGYAPFGKNPGTTFSLLLHYVNGVINYSQIINVKLDLNEQIFSF